ncbi:MAG: dTMP kinase [Ktedonobacterales bacterium]|nr:dTMP kinase [Ktedonobacterales bacterium]
MFITLEGIEGAGKSTQAVRLAERLRAAGHPAHLTREPGGTPLAGAIRALLLHPEESLRALAAHGLAQGLAPAAEELLSVTELLLLSAARAQHVARIREWLAAGEVVVCDRYADASRAYQGSGRGLDMGTIVTLESIATGGLRPDLTLLLDVPPEEGQQRKQQARAAGGEWNRLDAEGAAFHERVRAGYLALAAAEPDRFIVLDATLPPDTLAEHIWQGVSRGISSAPGTHPPAS